MDGTILNTLEDLADSVNYCLNRFGFPARTIEEIRRFVGNGIRRTIEQAVPAGTGEERIEEIFNDFNEYYNGHCAVKTGPYEGIAETLRKLKAAGILTAVVSNKADREVKLLCDKFFPGLFDYAVGNKEGCRRKPYPDSVYEVLRKFGINTGEAIYIGDSEVDYKTAVNAGLKVILVSWGFRGEEFLRRAGADYVVSEPSEIPGILID